MRRARRSCLASTFALTCLACFACRRSAEEPSPSPSAPTSVEQGDARSASAKKASPDRCIWEGPATPAPPVPPGPARGCPPDPSPHTLDLVTVGFPEATSGPASVTVELARAAADLQRGLMFRTSMDENRGMLFEMESRRVQEFWMRNTCIPLDMLFLDDDGLIVGILENVPTMNEKPRRVPCESTHVLEMNAGWSRRVGVHAGMHARLPGA